MREHLDAEAEGRGWWAVLPDLGEDECAPGRRPGRRRWAFARALVRLLNFATDGGGGWDYADGPVSVAKNALAGLPTDKLS